MPAKKRKESGTGTLIRSADGALYFVPDGEGLAFRLPEKYTGDARNLLDQLNFVAKEDGLAAIHGSGLVHRVGGPHDVLIYLNRLAALLKRTQHSK
jgi:hypothetical protein